MPEPTSEALSDPVIEEPNLDDEEQGEEGRATEDSSTSSLAEEVETPEPIVVPILEPDPLLLLNPSVEDDWSEPLNLSATGSADHPITLMDRSNILHIFWADDFDGLLYMRKNDALTKPVKVSTPFGQNRPKLLVDETNRVFAFWMNGESELLFSHAPADALHDPSAWSGPVALALGVVAFAAELDLAGQPHVAFHVSRNNNDFDAGIYYRTRPLDTGRWGLASTIYQSPYMRLADEENSQVALAMTSDRIFVTWANPGRDWVMMAKSDLGESWSSAKIIDQRTLDDDSRTFSPGAPLIFASGDQVLISWHAGHADFVCGRYFSHSNDGGETFSPAALSFGDLYECPRQSNLIPLDENGFLLLTRTDELTYLSVWRNGEWEGRIIQPTLVQFRETSTGRDIQMDCYQPSIAVDRVFLVSCDRNIGKDIWFSEYLLEDLIRNVTAERVRAEVIVDDIDVTPEAEIEPVEIAPVETPETSSNLFFGSGNGYTPLLLLFAGLLVVGFGVLTLFRRK